MKTIVSQNNRVYWELKTSLKRCVGKEVPFTLYTQGEQIVIEIKPTTRDFYDFINQYIG